MGKYCEKLKRGSIELLLLKLLSENDLYGYQIVQLFNDLTNETITLTIGNMYPTLYKLEEKGFVKSYRKLSGKRMERVYYHLTNLGKKELKEMIHDYNSVIDATNNILNYKSIISEAE
jgi:PadR family transcriptional regulator PadR